MLSPSIIFLYAAGGMSSSSTQGVNGVYIRRLIYALCSEGTALISNRWYHTFVTSTKMTIFVSPSLFPSAKNKYQIYCI